MKKLTKQQVIILHEILIKYSGGAGGVREYEIEKAYELGKGIVGVYIHGLKNADGEQATQGANPFYSINNKDGHRLSNYV